MKLPSFRSFPSSFSLVTAAVLALCATDSRAAGISLSTVYSFTNSVDPTTTMVLGTNGNFYGTTMTGGTNGKGSIFMFTPAGVYTDLVSFSGSNGAAPAARLYLDTNGTFYGTTSTGGARNLGVIFQMNHTGGFTNLAAFAQSNGATPLGSLIRGADQAIYGTASAGGSNGLGLIFSWAPHVGISNRYSFTTITGGSPRDGLVIATNGDFFGAVSVSTTNGIELTLFQFAPATDALATFTLSSSSSGVTPLALTASSNGLLYGVTVSGGSNDFGTVFQASTDGNLTTLASFDITNGSNPESPLTLGNDGYLYGTTIQGGANGEGEVFRIPTNSSGSTIGFGGGGGAGRFFGGFGGGTTSTNTSGIVNLVSFAGTNGANPVGGVVLGSDGDYYGTTTAGGAHGFGTIFKINGFPPSIFQQPTNVNYASNGTATFAVAAAGTQPLAYQWTFDGTNLNTSASITNVTNADLTISHETLANAGSYAVIITNLYGAVTSTVATVTIPTPTISIAMPAQPYVSVDTITIHGTASNNFGISSVQWQVNGGGFSDATITSHAAVSNWSALVTLQGGSNVIQAYSVDVIGDHSATNSVSVFYITHSSLSLTINGHGTISRKSPRPFGPTFTGTNLVVGSNYTITGVPAVNNDFSNWTGSITATNNPLTFTMTSNMTITANFVTNPFIPVSGSYAGLFYDTNTPGAESSGLMTSLVLRNDGAYSGQILVRGGRYAMAGAFNLYGESTTRVVRSTNLGDLSVSMQLNPEIKPPIITGTISGNDEGGWSANLTNQQYSTGLGSAEYTMIIPAGAGAPANAPGGASYALMTNHEGRISLSGRTADNGPFTENVPVTADLQIPFYAALYTNFGVIYGWLDLASGVPVGNVTWVRASGAGKIFPNGFTNIITVQSGLWNDLGNPTASDSFLNGGQLELAGGGLATALDFTVGFSNNKLLKEGALPTNSLSGSIAPKTGLLTLTFGNGDHRDTTTAVGALLQTANTISGFFIISTNAGTLTLTPNP